MTALIGALRVSLSADTAQFEQGMKRAQRQATASASGIQKSLGIIKSGLSGLVAGLSVGMFVNVIKDALDYAGSLGEVSQQLGVTTKDLQVFRFAAGQVGVSQEQLETGLSKLTITMGKVAAGAKAPAAALNAIGISADQLKGKDTGEAFRIIADGLQKITDRSQRAAVEVALFGKSGAMLDNLLAGGSGAINELSLAAEKLGIVLRDLQIEYAAATAHKLEALKTVLSARIAGVVADNADAILGFADSLVYLVGKVGAALEALAQLRAWFDEAAQLYSIPAQIKRAAGIPINANGIGQIAQNGGSVTLKLPPARPATPAKPTGGADIGKFLAGGGGGGSKKKGGGGASRADHSAEDALRDSFQFDQDIRRAQMDTLRAQQDLAANYIERTSVGIQILNAEQSAREAEFQYEAALYKLTKGKEGMSESQIQQLREQEAITDSLTRQKLLEEEQEQKNRDIQELIQGDFDRRRAVLESQANLAKTADERRKIELELLNLAYEQKRQALQAIIEQSKDIAAQEQARRDLENLNKTFGNDRQSVIENTRNPLEEWAASIPQTADQITEAFQKIQADGLDRLSDSIADVILGTKSLKDAAHEMAAQFIADSIRMIARMLLMKALTAAIGGMSGGGSVGGGDIASSGIYPDLGFASGGFVSGPGGPKEDRVPAMLSAGEFVVNAAAARKFLPLLKALNEGNVQHRKRGGLMSGLFGGAFGAMSGLFGGKLSALGGFAFSDKARGGLPFGAFGKLLGFSEGGMVPHGLPIARASYGQPVVANENNVSVTPMSLTFHNDFRGADQSAVAAIQARLDRMQAELPSTIVGTVQDAKQRFIIR